MAAIPLIGNGENVEPSFIAGLARIVPSIATEAVTKGKGVTHAAGGVAVANATNGIGVCLTDANANQSVDVLLYGHLGGFDLSGLNEGDPVYFSASGDLDDAGTVVVGTIFYSGADESGKVILINLS